MDIKKIAGEAPKEPGVYLIRDSESNIIYIGKARILRNRLSSYFSGEKDIKTRTLLKKAASIETIIVNDEYEALRLENTLIKQHSPKYNINLKDGKTYPVIRLTSELYPRVFRTRYVVEDGSAYFGPFPNVGAMDDMLDIIDRVFCLRKCRTRQSGWATRLRSSAKNSPCMYHHIGRCAAPCCGRISSADYSLQVERVRKLLSGETESLLAELYAEMKQQAEALRYEKAAQIRNAIKIIESLNESSAVVDFDPGGRDYIAWAAEGVFAVYSVFSMREGKMVGRDLYRTKSASDEWESLELFITSYYSGSRPPPPKIFVPSCPGDMNNEGSILKGWFTENFGHEPELLIPADKHHTAILAMAAQNAEEELRRRQRERGAGPALDELKELLSLKNRPERIEGFDISQLDGKHPVASLVSFSGGMPDKKNYRHFKLRSVIGVVDDYGAMREAVSRRYSRLIRESEKTSPENNPSLPDLILIDGGLGQVNAAKAVLNELGLSCDVAGLAKKEEEIWFPNAKDPVRLARNSEALRLLQYVRDETHRFATKLNQKLRSADLRLETLESIEGIGPRRAAMLMNHYNSLRNIAEAHTEEIARICGCGSSAARAVRAAAKLAVTEHSRKFVSAANLAQEALNEGMAAEKQTPYSSN